MESNAFIWDLDGTLLDSYDEITSSIYLTLKQFHIPKEEKEIREYITKYSVKQYLKEQEYDYDVLNKVYQTYHTQKYLEVKLMNGAKEILEYLKNQGCRHFVFTHRGETTLPILKHLKIDDYFEEIVSVTDGFERKPSPQAVLYLISKYQLDPESTYYVGDRQLDLECGKNAGIQTIFYNSETNAYADYVIKDFKEMKATF